MVVRNGRGNWRSVLEMNLSLFFVQDKNLVVFIHGHTQGRQFKIYWVPAPGPLTRGEVFFDRKKGVKRFFREKRGVDFLKNVYEATK